MNIKPMSQRVIINGTRFLPAVIGGTIVEVSDDLMFDQKLRIGKRVWVPAEAALSIEFKYSQCYIVKAEDVAAIEEEEKAEK